MTTAHKVTITKADGSKGTLTKGADGKWSIEINGKTGATAYYTTEQVAAIIAKARAAGSTVEED